MKTCDKKLYATGRLETTIYPFYISKLAACIREQQPGEVSSSIQKHLDVIHLFLIRQPLSLLEVKLSPKPKTQDLASVIDFLMHKANGGRCGSQIPPVDVIFTIPSVHKMSISCYYDAENRRILLFRFTSNWMRCCCCYRGVYVPGAPYYEDSAVYQTQHVMQPGQQQIVSPLTMATNGHIMNDMMSPNAMLNNDALSPSGTPTRGSKARPSQPPPAPPSATNSSSRYF